MITSQPKTKIATTKYRNIGQLGEIFRLTFLDQLWRHEANFCLCREPPYTPKNNVTKAKKKLAVMACNVYTLLLLLLLLLFTLQGKVMIFFVVCLSVRQFVSIQISTYSSQMEVPVAIFTKSNGCLLHWLWLNWSLD